MSGHTERAAAQTRLLETAPGRVTFLRVHEVGTGYGPSGDFLDVEVVFKLDSAPENAFGFQLRDDTNARAHQGMLDILRDAFNNNWSVIADYNIESGNKNGTAIRVALTKT